MDKKNSFLMALLGVTTIGVVVFHVLKQQMGFVLDDWKVYVTLGLFAAITWLSHRQMASAIGQRPAAFANRFMGSILAKLMLGFLLFIIIALTSDKEQIMAYGITFLLVYIVYSMLSAGFAMMLKDEKK